MTGRPKSVGVIAWILIVTGGLSLASVFVFLDSAEVQAAMAKNLLPIGVQNAMTLVGGVLFLACGLAMLKGKGWGRLVYVCWNVAILVVGLFTSPVKTMLIPRVVVFGVSTYFLYRPRASAFFARSAEP